MSLFVQNETVDEGQRDYLAKPTLRKNPLNFKLRAPKTEGRMAAMTRKPSTREAGKRGGR